MQGIGDIHAGHSTIEKKEKEIESVRKEFSLDVGLLQERLTSAMSKAEEYKTKIQQQDQAIYSLRHTNRALVQTNSVLTEKVKDITKQFCDVKNQNRRLAIETNSDPCPLLPKLVHTNTQCGGSFTEPSKKRRKVDCDAEHIMPSDFYMKMILDIRETLLCKLDCATCVYN